MIERIAEIFELSVDSTHLQQALTHPSFANENRQVEDNQRLEFLGDAVLGLCISDFLYTQRPDADEGTLTLLRAQLVNTEWLATWGRSVGIQEDIRLGRGALVPGLSVSNNVVADAVEACVAATFLSLGLEAAHRACMRIMQPALERALTNSQQDPKSELQQIVQALGIGLPQYEVLTASGPAHDRCFEVRVGAAGRWLAQGTGRSKRAAERAAAASLLTQREELLLPLATAASNPESESES
jgi:ribonuclease III